MRILFAAAQAAEKISFTDHRFVQPFAAAQAAEKIKQKVVWVDPAFAAAQAAEKTRTVRLVSFSRFAAAQAAEKSPGSEPSIARGVPTCLRRLEDDATGRLGGVDLGEAPPGSPAPARTPP